MLLGTKRKIDRLKIIALNAKNRNEFLKFHTIHLKFVRFHNIVLNEEFGFGRNRLLKLQDKFNDKFAEYGNLVAEDVHYGSTKLRDRVNQIMKEPASQNI